MNLILCLQQLLMLIITVRKEPYMYIYGYVTTPTHTPFKECVKWVPVPVCSLCLGLKLSEGPSSS